MKSGVVVISGGLDSTTLAYKVKAEGLDVYGISFDYGQKHGKELEFAHLTMQTIGEDHKIVDLGQSLKPLFVESGSSLVTDTDVPEGHYGADNMKATVVPNRNMIMLSIAAAYAVSIGADSLWTGVHAGDHFIYPDCRPQFIYAANAAIVRGNEGFGPIPEGSEFAHPTDYLFAPFLHASKNHIAAEAVRLGVPIDQTWSCYKGGELHCGKCGTCVERQEALNSQEVKMFDANFVDPTEYEDSEYWKTVIG